MKTNSKQRLFEVMGRLDKTFKTKLNEEFESEVEEIETTNDAMITPEANEPKELSTDEKLAALTAKIDSLYAMVHGDENGEEEAEEKEENIEGESSEDEIEISEVKKPKIPVANIAKVGK
jgi:hypothetical protein